MRFPALVLGLAWALLAAPLVVEAQPAGQVQRIGYLSPRSPSDPEGQASPIGERGLAAFRQGLRELGYVEGQNIAIENRWAEGRFERLPDLAVELVRLKVDVIVSVVTQASLEHVEAGLPHLLRAEHPRVVSARRHLCRQDPQGRQTCGPARGAAHEVRVRNQPSNRQGTQPDDPTVGAGAGG
jgi:hypothetical protein